MNINMCTTNIRYLFVAFVISVVWFSTNVSSLDINKNGKMVVDLIKKFGYPVEVFNLVTEDNYVLTTLRITGGRFERDKVPQNSSAKPVVMLMHGLFVSSYEYVCTGPGHSLALMLADSGFDVWIPNSRGSIVSRKHVYLNPDHDRKYWDFSWHEIGVYDIPANVDLIMNVTEQDKMAYVGCFQASTEFYVMGAVRSEYNKYFKVAMHLGPVVYLKHSTNFIIKIVMQIIEPLKMLAKVLDLHELLPPIFSPIVKGILRSMCGEGNILQPVCMKLLMNFMDPTYDTNALNKKTFLTFIQNSAFGASVRQVLHYAQILTTGEFEQYDFGKEENLMRYNSEKPPPYNLSSVNVPILLFVGEKDMFAEKTDLDRTIAELPNNTVVRVGHDYTHFDYLLAGDAPEIVHKQIIKFIRIYLQNINQDL